MLCMGCSARVTSLLIIIILLYCVGHVCIMVGGGPIRAGAVFDCFPAAPHGMNEVFVTGLLRLSPQLPVLLFVAIDRQF